MTVHTPLDAGDAATYVATGSGQSSRSLPPTTGPGFSINFNVSFRDCCGLSDFWDTSSKLIITCTKTVGFVCTIFSLAYFALRNDNLARWTAIKEFYELCNSENVPRGLDCSSISGKSLQPPPYSSNNTFLERRHLSPTTLIQPLRSNPQAITAQPHDVALEITEIQSSESRSQSVWSWTWTFSYLACEILTVVVLLAFIAFRHIRHRRRRHAGFALFADQESGDYHVESQRAVSTAMAYVNSSQAQPTARSVATTSQIFERPRTQQLRRRIASPSPPSMHKASPFFSQSSNLPPAFIADFIRRGFADDICKADSGQVLTAIEGFRTLQSQAEMEVSIVTQALTRALPPNAAIEEVIPGNLIIGVPTSKTDAERLAQSLARQRTSAEIKRLEMKVESSRTLYLNVVELLRFWVHIHASSLAPRKRQELDNLLSTLAGEASQASQESQTPAIARVAFASSMVAESSRLSKPSNGSGYRSWPHIRSLLNQYIDEANDLIQHCAAINLRDSESCGDSMHVAS